MLPQHSLTAPQVSAQLSPDMATRKAIQTGNFLVAGAGIKPSSQTEKLIVCHCWKLVANLSQRVKGQILGPTCDPCIWNSFILPFILQKSKYIWSCASLLSTLYDVQQNLTRVQHSVPIPVVFRLIIALTSASPTGLLAVRGHTQGCDNLGARSSLSLVTLQAQRHVCVCVRNVGNIFGCVLK